MRRIKLLAAALTALATALTVTPAAAGAAPPRPDRDAATAAAVTCLPQQVTLQSSRNNKYVSVEKNYTGSDYAMLRARADAVGPWEDFRLCYDPAWAWNEFALLATTNNRYVSAEFDYAGSNKGMLRARAATPGQWERFLWNGAGNTSTLQFGASRLYVSAELDYTGGRQAMLRARATAPGPWEQFTIRW